MSGKLFDLSGKRALVTGSRRGIGLELARGLAGAGASVILNGRDEAGLAAAVRQLEGLGLQAHFVVMDVRNEAEVAEGVRAIEEDIGPIDILINNAGIQRRGSLETIAATTWQEVIDTNLTASFLVAKHVVPGMIDRGRGKIINICSLMSEIGRAGTGPYTAAKGGLKMLTRAMAVDWARHNIQINGIGPGYFLTEMTRPLAEDASFDSWLKRRTPAGRWGNVSELAGTAIYLASSASDFVNGQIIYVDGGVLASL